MLKEFDRARSFQLLVVGTGEIEVLLKWFDLAQLKLLSTIFGKMPCFQGWRSKANAPIFERSLSEPIFENMKECDRVK